MQSLEPSHYVIKLREADINDAMNILTWRNHALVRNSALDSKAIGEQEHMNWFKGVIDSANKILFLALEKNKEIGVVHYNLNEYKASADVSIYLNPSLIGKGLGKAVLLESIKYLKKNMKKIKKINATVLVENKRSLRMFENCGFEEHSVNMELQL